MAPMLCFRGGIMASQHAGLPRMCFLS
ncbi:hypothetical protein VTH06DRAFT_4650 [Thermothelomyces fergusii]